MDNELSVNNASKLLSAAVLGVEAYIVEVEPHHTVSDPGAARLSP